MTNRKEDWIAHLKSLSNRQLWDTFLNEMKPDDCDGSFTPEGEERANAAQEEVERRLSDWLLKGFAMTQHTETDTPRTDVERVDVASIWNGAASDCYSAYVSYEFAKQLERELSALQAKTNELKSMCARWYELYNKVLHEGDILRTHARFLSNVRKENDGKERALGATRSET